jgi:hypothetical protein
MAQTSINVLLPKLAHPGADGAVASKTGDRIQAAAYHLANRDLQTVTWSVSSTFVGKITIQASLATDPGNVDWFPLYAINTLVAKNGYYNLSGNYVWIRAVVSDWTRGALQLVTLTY